MKPADKKYALTPKTCPRVKRFMSASLSSVLSIFIAIATAIVGFPVAPVLAATVAAVNQTPISSLAVNGALQAYLSRIGHRELPASRMQSLREEILKRLIEEELLYQEGLKEGLPVTENEIDTGVALIRGRFQSDHSYELAVQKEALQRKDIRSGVKRSILINKTWSHLSTLTQAEKIMRLKAISESADIQINLNERISGHDRTVSGE